MRYEVLNGLPDSTEVLILPLAQSDTPLNPSSLSEPWKTILSASVLADFKADYKEILPLYSGDSRFFLLGLGKHSGYGEIQAAFRLFTHRWKSRLPESLCIDLSQHGNHVVHMAAAAQHGILLGLYDIGLYKTEAKTSVALLAEGAVVRFVVAEAVEQSTLLEIRTAEALAKSQIAVLNLINTPSNRLHPMDVAAWARQSAERHGYQARVYERAALEELGFHGLLAVSRGSEVAPCLVVAEYSPEGANDQTPLIGLVGKGVTFDTGGISIKPANNMHYMKSDMSGAAVVLGTVEAMARIRPNVRIIAVAPLTENCVDATALKPGDVIGSYSGKTVEVIDTDAEGRLILMDALSYLIRQHQPDVVIDLATLTGSCIAALGFSVAGLFSQNDQLALALSQSGEAAGERVWRLPLWDSYAEEMKSDVADIKNLASRPVAGAITAAKFLEAFTDKHPAWAHLDIAGVSFTDSEFSSMRCASGYGIKLLERFIQHYAAQPLQR